MGLIISNMKKNKSCQSNDFYVIGLKKVQTERINFAKDRLLSCFVTSFLVTLHHKQTTVGV